MSSSPMLVMLAMSFASSATARSEEHTSELQSQSNLVCRLLLEKKKTVAAPRLYRGARIAARGRLQVIFGKGACLRSRLPTSVFAQAHSFAAMEQLPRSTSATVA